MYWLSQNGDYYENDRQSPDDIAVPRRPDILYQWVNGVWAINLSSAQDEKWNEIKAKRDFIQSSGVEVGGKWFNSDANSRIQQLGLVLFGVAVPPVQWKTMDGTFVTMTQGIANDILQSTGISDMNIFSIAETHKIAMLLVDDPDNYDYSTGWPLTFGE